MYLLNWIFLFSPIACWFIIRIPTFNKATRVHTNVHEELWHFNFKTEKAKTCVAAEKSDKQFYKFILPTCKHLLHMSLLSIQLKIAFFADWQNRSLKEVAKNN